MNINRILENIFNENNIIESKIKMPITLRECIKEFDVDDNFDCKLVVNCYTLDTQNNESIDPNFRRELFKQIEDSKKVRNSVRVERRAFCNFLKMKYPQEYLDIKFIDQESPDYLVFDSYASYYIEVVEATNSQEAQFSTMLRLNTGRGKSKQDYENYIANKHKTTGKNFYIDEIDDGIILSPYKGLVDTCRTREEIIEAIVSKVDKYKKYKVADNHKCILVSYSSLGFDNEWDFKEVGKIISQNTKITESDIYKVFVTSSLYETLIEYTN